MLAGIAQNVDPLGIGIVATAFLFGALVVVLSVALIVFSILVRGGRGWARHTATAILVLMTGLFVATSLYAGTPLGGMAGSITFYGGLIVLLWLPTSNRFFAYAQDR